MFSQWRSGAARWSGLRVRAVAAVERTVGRSAGRRTAPPGAPFVMKLRCVCLRSEPLSFPLVFRLQHDLESPSHPVSTCLTHPLPTTHPPPTADPLIVPQHLTHIDLYVSSSCLSRKCLLILQEPSRIPCVHKHFHYPSEEFSGSPVPFLGLLYYSCVFM